MNSTADLGGIFIILNVTSLAYAPIINMRQVGPFEACWIVISSEEATGQAQAGFVYFWWCFENVHKRRSPDTFK